MHKGTGSVVHPQGRQWPPRGTGRRCQEVLASAPDRAIQSRPPGLQHPPGPILICLPGGLSVHASQVTPQETRQENCILRNEILLGRGELWQSKATEELELFPCSFPPGSVFAPGAGEFTTAEHAQPHWLAQAGHRRLEHWDIRSTEEALGTCMAEHHPTLHLTDLKPSQAIKFKGLDGNEVTSHENCQMINLLRYKLF